MIEKEKFEEAKRLYKTANADQKYVLESLFPELKESEDEKISREITEFIVNVHNGNYEKPYDCTIGTWLAWLDKQVGKDKLIQELGKYKVKYTQEILSQQLEKHSKQKTTNKVEPKFKVGDWVLNNVCFPVQITSIKDGMYIFTEGDAMSVSFVDENYHLWTIQDAKDGDVLCTYECDEPKIVFIIKGTPKKHYALSYYCYYNIMYPHFKSDSERGCLVPNDEDVKPATKEQCDTLFAKMKKVGYKWDEEKKELRKMEQKSNDKLDPLIDDEIDLWIKENSNIHHNNNDIVELMRNMAYYVATLTRNLYR